MAPTRTPSDGPPTPAPTGRQAWPRSPYEVDLQAWSATFGGPPPQEPGAPFHLHLALGGDVTINVDWQFLVAHDVEALELAVAGLGSLRGFGEKLLDLAVKPDRLGKFLHVALSVGDHDVQLGPRPASTTSGTSSRTTGSAAPSMTSRTRAMTDGSSGDGACAERLRATRRMPARVDAEARCMPESYSAGRHARPVSDAGFVRRPAVGAPAGPRPAHGRSSPRWT